MVRRVAIFILAVGFIIACLGIGWAEDRPATGYNWTGVYVGVNGGWARGMSDATTTTVFSPIGYFAPTSPGAVASAGNQKLDSDNFTGGVQTGYNWQIGKFLIGGELDFNYLGIDDRKSCTTGYPCCAPTTLTVESRIRTNWFFTARPRIGFVMDNWLFFATGGLALTTIKADFKFTDTIAGLYEPATKKSTNAGWTVGGGVETGLAKNWSLKAEYLYTDFGDVSTTGRVTGFGDVPITGRVTGASIPGFVASAANNPFSHKIDLRTHMVRIGLNYRF